MARRSVWLDPAEQAALDQVRVRLITPEEQARWDDLITTRHYLKNATLVGERLCYVVIDASDQWLALLGWSAAAYHLKGRDTWLGWSDEQRRRRLHLLANNARFLLLTAPGQLPNLASRVLALCCARLSDDWQAAYGHPIVAVESFVDAQLFRGTAYKAAGWHALGATAGFTRVSEDFYVAHDRPKTLYVRLLHKRAAQWLRRPQLPEALAPYERDVKPRCPQSAAQLGSLWEHLHRSVPETRAAKGLRHKQATVLAITIAWLLTGQRGGHRAIVLFAQSLTQAQRVRLRCWRNPKTHEYEVPAENCFYRVLTALPVPQLGQALVQWQQLRHSAHDGNLIALDGKTLKGSQSTHLVGALNLGSQRWLDLERVPDKTNEIPAAQTLIERLELDEMIAVLDALHTQTQTARAIVQEQGGDYVLCIKGNQPGLQRQAQTLLPASFPPSARGD
jgi:Druantia protein DruA/DDE_Tnp_1-associated